MRGSPLVFISSTSDLSAERQALAQKLRPLYEPYLYEEDRAGSKSPEARCREMIEASDVFVCLLGASYGSVYAFDVGSQSIVEWEFDTARHRDTLELMTFRKEPLTGADPRQQAFIDRVTRFRGGHWCKAFGTTDQLAGSVGESLHRWLIEFHASVAAARARHRAPAQMWFRGLCTAAAVGLAAAALGPWRTNFTSASLLAAACAVACLIALALVFERGGRHEPT